MASPSERAIAFVRHLRSEGFALGAGVSADVLRVVAFAGVCGVERVRRQLRSLLCQDHDEWRRFPSLFDAFWGLGGAAAGAPTPLARMDPRLRERAPGDGTGLAGTSDGPGGEGRGAGRQMTLSRADYRFLTDARDRREIERTAERMARALRHRTHKRKRIVRRGRRVHLRRTLRTSFRYGGLPLHPRFVVRRPDPPELLLVQDISHSMAPYSALLTRLCRGLLRGVPKAEAFAFHTRVYRVSDIYRIRDAATAKDRLDAMNHLWLGGTRIAESLSEINRTYARRMVNARTVAVIMSDGFDSDDTADLARELAELRRRARRLLWLNPALALHADAAQRVPGALRREIDALLPAHNLEALSRAIDRMLDA